ncbi:hypothetical protein EM151A_2722 [Enterococcus mundtii]|uniref:Uncharacterized protein n=1 Tax=Enterococcus mundtii TaxID=53346 RepID=A0AAI8RBQ3_ENTMU|nr:hypothetical protein EM151A_2722 [Enterococcus mundtii]GKS54497.1 hypothetical protein EMLAB_11120 [Enterococcus mundtii]
MLYKLFLKFNNICSIFFRSEYVKKRNRKPLIDKVCYVLFDIIQPQKNENSIKRRDGLL